MTLVQRWRKLIFLEHKPESGEVVLRQRRVFTVPSKPGWMFILLLLILFIASTNYNLSLGFALTFVLAAVAAINAFFGFRNLAYLHLHAGTVSPVFAGEDARYTIHIDNRHAYTRYAIWIGFHHHAYPAKPCDIAAHSQLSLQLSYPTSERGWQPIPRIRLETWFPLGLLRAWSTWLPDSQALVYPRPEPDPPPLPRAGNQQQDHAGQSGQEDFSGVRAYQPGDALKHLAWKHIARIDTAIGGQLISKQFSGGSGTDIRLDFHALPRHMDTELKLSRMTSWVLEADNSGQNYSFCLNQHQFPAASGIAHRDACLRALALFEQ